jgi:hypothetical protein
MLSCLGGSSKIHTLVIRLMSRHKKNWKIKNPFFRNLSKSSQKKPTHYSLREYDLMIKFYIHSKESQQINANQVEVEVPVEVATDELVDLLLAPCVQVLEFVKVAHNIQTKNYNNCLSLKSISTNKRSVSKILYLITKAHKLT